jgi:hypothetical protein
MPKLSDTRIRAAKPRQKPYKLFDTEGLFLVVAPSGGRWWRQRYRLAGKEQLLSLGVYPEVGLADARERSAAVRKQIANAIDPSVDRKAKRVAQLNAKANTFKTVALDWHKKFSPGWTPRHAKRVLRRLEMHVFSKMGEKAIRDVTGGDAQAVLAALNEKNKVDTALRCLQYMKDIAIYAAGRQPPLISASPFAHIKAKHELPSVKVKHRAAIKDPRALGALLRSIDGYTGS